MPTDLACHKLIPQEEMLARTGKKVKWLNELARRGYLVKSKRGKMWCWQSWISYCEGNKGCNCEEF